jgi:4-amino-4-deoxy-L-arabinose transferase-like glycosyltransferase
MVIALLILFSLVCFYVACDSFGKKRFLLFTLFFAGMALGTLTKGPLVIAFYLGIVATFLFFQNKFKVLIEPGCLWGWVFFTLILLLWVLPYLTRGPFFIVAQKFSLSEILSRPEPWYYYLLEFWPRFAPWSLFLPSAALFLFRKNPDQHYARLFLLCWVGIVLVLIFPAHNKTYRYFLPILPAYSIILGAAFKEGFLSAGVHKEDWLVRSWQYSTWTCLILFIIFLVPAPFLAWRFTHSFAVVVVSTGVFLLGGLLIVYGLRKSELLSKVVVISLLSLLIYETYYYFISREDKLHSPFMQIAENVKSRIGSKALCFFDFGGEKSILLDYYLDIVAPKFSEASEVVNFMTKNNEPHACLTSQRGFARISQVLAPKNLEVFPITYYKKATYYLIILQKE